MGEAAVFAAGVLYGLGSAWVIRRALHSARNRRDRRRLVERLEELRRAG